MLFDDYADLGALVFWDGGVSLLLCLGGLLGVGVVALAARAFRRATAKHAGRISHCGLSGRRVAERLLKVCGLTNVTVSQGAKLDAYRPWRRQVHLADSSYDAPTVWSLAVAAHEVGHAQQFAKGYWPARLWWVTTPLSIALLLGALGVALSLIGGWFHHAYLDNSWMIPSAAAVAILLQAPVHLPMECDASRRAKQLVRDSGILTENEAPIFDELLQAAWKTHLAVNIQRWVMLVVVVGATFMLDGLLTSIEEEPLPRDYRIEAAPIQPQEFAPTTDRPPTGNVSPPFGEWFWLLSDLLIMLALAGCAVIFLCLGRLEKFFKHKPTAHELAVQSNNKASSLQARGRSQEAIAEYGKAIELNADFSIAYYNRGTVLWSLGKFDEALADFDIVIEQAPHFADGLARHGCVQAYRGDFDEALRDCEAALAIDPDCDVALSGRGTVRQAREDYLGAIEDFDAALAVQPDRWDVYRDRGLAKFHSGDLTGAVADADRTLQAAPNDFIALNNRAAALIALGEHRRALDDLNKAIQLAPQFANPYKHLAWIQATSPELILRDGKRAVANATKALELVDWKQTAWFEVLAAAHAAAGEFDEAIRWQRKFLADDESKDNAHAAQTLALCEAGEGYRAPAESAAN